MTELTAQTARELLTYDPETGKLVWRNRDRKWFSSDSQFKTWNKRFSGKEAFTADNGYGYRQGAIFYQSYLAHRVIWLIQTGEWPTDQIDHNNHDRSDNRWRNLRVVTQSENNKNQSHPKNNTSGYVGVCWNIRSQKWLAYITIGGDRIHLGLFDRLEEAAAARKTAERELGFSNEQIARMIGDKTDRMGGHYARGADQMALAKMVKEAKR